MTGTWINAGLVLAGGLLGLLLKKGLPERVKGTMLQMVGLSVGLIGLSGVLCAMLTADPATGALQEGGSLLLLLSLVLGGAAGEWLHLQEGVDSLGAWVERRVGGEGFAAGFVTATLVFCVGAMTVVGAINDGLRGDSSVLVLKGVIDGITATILASTLGWGVAAASVGVLAVQGSIALAAGLLAPVLQGQLLTEICMVGYAIVICIGCNLLGVTRVRTASLLPAMLVPVAASLLGL